MKWHDWLYWLIGLALVCALLLLPILMGDPAVLIDGMKPGR